MIISSTVTHFFVKPCYGEATLSVKVPFSSADPVYKSILRLIPSGYKFLDLLKPCYFRSIISVLADPQAGTPSGGHSWGLQPHNAFLPEASYGEEPSSTQLSIWTTQRGSHQPIQGGSASLLEPGLSAGGGHAYSAPTTEREPWHHARYAAHTASLMIRAISLLKHVPLGVLQSRHFVLRILAT